MLLIGGFTISSALSKTNIDRVIFTRVLYYAGTKPKTVILAFMFVSCFASMLIRYGRYFKDQSFANLDDSNVAAPTLCFTLIRVGPSAPLVGLLLTSVAAYPPDPTSQV